jgi:ubiquinone/menaquinone biosynthesis C-methylase UbiE
MQRIPEPELMDEDEQARAYAEADFSEPHEQFVALFGEAFPNLELAGTALDLGCGPADVTLRFARAHPRCRIDGVDGAGAMLRFGREAVRRAGLEERVRLVRGCLPDAVLPLEAYDAVISNSLLHHLADPNVLWASARRWGKPGAPVFIMDLMRPDNIEQAERLVRLYAAAEPEILRRDFYNSLRAAYRPEEVREQLRAADLTGLDCRPVSDRHLVVSGRLAG